MSRYDDLRAALFPMLINQDDCKEHPEDFVPGSEAEIERSLVEWRKAHKVTPDEWHSLTKEYAELPF